MPDIAILICTYNPEPAILGRVLNALAGLQGLETAEVVLVDNNSGPPIADLASVREFLARVPAARVIREPRQGLSHARHAGVAATAAPIIVFCDDDNVLAPDYLDQVRRLTGENLLVGCWGPGRVTVEFTGPVPDWVDRYTRGIFQEKHISLAEYGCAVGRYPFYPFGSGMVIRRAVLELHMREAEARGYRTTDRKGSALASSGDTQLAYTAIREGLAVGVSPDLALAHLIHPRRCSLRYLCRLLYGSAASADLARVEVFPDLLETIELPGRREVLATLAVKVLRVAFARSRVLRILDLAEYCGAIAGRFHARHAPIPQPLALVFKLFGESQLRREVLDPG